MQWDDGVSGYRNAIQLTATLLFIHPFTTFHFNRFHLDSIFYCNTQGKFSTKSDVWSFAITLWEILTFAREQPFENLSDEKVVENFGHIYKDDKKHVSNNFQLWLYYFCIQNFFFVLFVHFSLRQMTSKRRRRRRTFLSRIFQIFTFNLKSHCAVFRRSTWMSFVIKFLWGHISLSLFFLLSQEVRLLILKYLWINAKRSIPKDANMITIIFVL